jgi:hypothetical protein
MYVSYSILYIIFFSLLWENVQLVVTNETLTTEPQSYVSQINRKCYLNLPVQTPWKVTIPPLVLLLLASSGWDTLNAFKCQTKKCRMTNLKHWQLSVQITEKMCVAYTACEKKNWIQLAEDEVQQRTLVNTVTNFRDHTSGPVLQKMHGC